MPVISTGLFTGVLQIVRCCIAEYLQVISTQIPDGRTDGWTDGQEELDLNMDVRIFVSRYESVKLYAHFYLFPLWQYRFLAH